MKKTDRIGAMTVMAIITLNAIATVYLLARDRYQAPDAAIHEVLVNYKTQYNIEHFGHDELQARKAAIEWAKLQMGTD